MSQSFVLEPLERQASPPAERQVLARVLPAAKLALGRRRRVGERAKPTPSGRLNRRDPNGRFRVDFGL